MNSLSEKYGDKLAVLAFPCNQFGHQANEGAGEFLNTLKHVRPGNGFEPKADVFQKVEVNGGTAEPLFKWLTSSLKYPSDPDEEKADLLINPRAGFGNTTVALWTPVKRSDIAWNFEKFLIDKDGKPVKRYSRYYDTNAIASDIDECL